MSENICFRVLLLTLLSYHSSVVNVRCFGSSPSFFYRLIRDSTWLPPPLSQPFSPRHKQVL